MKYSPDPWDPVSHPAFWINQISRMLVRDFEAQLRPLGFGMAYLPVVSALAEYGPLQQKQLVEMIGVEQPTMAALLARMERDGVVERTPHPTDKRSSRFDLVAAARKRVPQARRALAQTAEQALTGLKPGERDALLGLLRRVAANLGDVPDRFPAPPGGA
jgi:DNA-binding MarR family transcriptional regulator